MSEENRKSNKQYTGTVPKIKYRNNSSYYTNDQERSRSLSNNLSTTWHHPPETANFIRNSRRNPQSNYFTMDSAMEDHHSIPLQNGGPNYVNSSSLTPNGSAPLSRRDSASSSLKCDNVTKYPDKKQIEDKLSQIREYLQITSSLMTSMKNTDEQLDATDEEEKNNLTKMINDLKDSENKLVHMLYGCADENENSSETSGVVITELSPEIVENGVDALSVNSAGSSKRHEIDLNNLDHQDLDVLREQQLALIKLQQKAENKLRDARQIQERMMAQSQYSNDITPANQKDNKNMSIAEFDVEIQKLEERTKRLAEPRQRNISNPNQDRILNEVECLHNKIVTMRNANNEREQLIEVLDTRDTELRSQQAQLQNKLLELQNKKQQIDQLVTQLQTMDEEEGEGNNMGGQVRKIVTMKDQLKKLKDMLEIVKTTENVMSTNPSAEAQAAAFDICTSAENFLQNEIQKPRLPTNCDSNIVIRYDNDTSNDNTRQKQTNKNSRDSGRDAKSRTTSINANEQQAALQAELKAKKRELEDIMGKHKAGTSNLNHDVGIDSSKSEFSCTSNSNTVNEVFWRPTISQIQDDASDRFSSDDCDGEEDYPSGNQENPIVAQLPSLRYSPSNAAKIRQDNNSDYAFPTERLPSLTRTPERNVRSSSVATSGYVREQPRSNNEHDKLQKQLHLIKSVCDSMLAQQNNSNSTNNQQSNVHQVRNNLTPSSIYSEPGGRYQSPNPHPLNMVNVINSDLPWMNGHNGPNPQVDMGNYQSWLATNTLQTQSFMLNTLNQCCQMLWLQQRELASLRNAVTSLQDRFDFVHPPHIPPSAPPTPLDHQQQRSSSNQYRPLPNNPKTNQVSAACSLPNLNHYNAPPTSNLANHYNAPPTSNLTNHYNGPPTSSNLTNHFNAPPPQTFNASNLANHYNSNVDLTYANQQQLNNAISSNMSEHGSNNLHGLNNNVGQATQSVPAQIWNGPALNNQVAPGNRANNYWDNFRSYSRQNLLSTKNTEGFHNQPSNSVDRSNVSSDHRTNPFTLMSFSKSNSEQDSASTSQENTPQRRRVPFKTPRHIENVPIPPPDVLNVNQNPIIKTERGSSNTTAESDIIDDDNNVSSLGYHVTSLNLNPICDAAQGSGGGSSGAEGGGYKEKEQRRRNEWNGEGQEGRQQKSKLFDELRDNVYKEVASLISANEARPHFLIQLFRDLQMIGSDSLRLKILQSIQSVVTHSLISTQSSNRQSFESQQSRDSDPLSLQENFSLQSTVWSKPMKTFLTGTRNIINMENDEMDVQNAFREIIPMLNDNEDEVVTNQFLISLKQMFLESESFKETVKDTIFQKHFSNVLDEVLEQYCGKKVRDVKLHLIQTVGDLLRGELSFIQLIQETNPENCEPTSNAAHHYSSHPSSNLFDTPPFGSGGNIGGANMGGVMGAGGVIVNMAGNIGGMGVAIVGQPGVSLASSQVSGETINNIQNGDLAEADQLGRGVGAVEELDEEEEEGAVGGVLEAPMEDEMDHPISQGNSEEILNLPSIDFPCNAEGLDQVPTRLPTKIKSRSTTPTKDRSNSDAETF